MAGIDLRRERYERDFEMINEYRVPSSSKRSGWCECISCQYPLYIAYTSFKKAQSAKTTSGEDSYEALVAAHSVLIGELAAEIITRLREF